MEFQFENLKDKFLTLPPILQEAISSVDVADKIYEIGQNNDLRIDEMGVIAKEAGLVMLGMTHPDGFVEKVAKQLPHIDRAKIEKVVSEVNEEVFKEIRSALVDIHKKEEAPVVPPTPIAVQAPVVPQQNEIAKTKLEQSFRLPPQTATVSLNQSVPAQPAQAPKPIQHREVDPYREPIQ